MRRYIYLKEFKNTYIKKNHQSMSDEYNHWWNIGIGIPTKQT